MRDSARGGGRWVLRRFSTGRVSGHFEWETTNMPSAYAGKLRGFVCGSLFYCLAAWACAAGWSDNFDDKNIADGNPVTWSTNLAGAFPGIYDASSGDLHLSRPGSGNNNQLVAWVNNMSFPDTYIRAQGIVMPGSQPEETGGNLALLARIDPNFVFAYILYIDDAGNLGLQFAQGGAPTDLVPNVDLPFNAGSEVIIELNVIGTELFGYAWQPGESKPATPQISAIDFAFTSGPAGIAYDEDDDNTTGVFRWVMAQDTPFVDAIAGDFNTDGKVDAADYVFWRDRLGNPFTPQDYNVWRTNFGAGQAASGALGVSASVPEPSGLVLLLLAISGAVAWQRARR
jgi:hypothetical protein